MEPKARYKQTHLERMSYNLKEGFPRMQGFLPRNPTHMRKFAEARPDLEFVQRSVAQIPWRSNITLLDKLSDAETRLWYAQKTIENGFGKDMLVYQIASQLHKRQGAAITKLRCYVVVEQKEGAFEPRFVSKLNMYQNVINDTLNHPNDQPSIGLLLVKSKNKLVVEYFLAGYTNPIGIANWEKQITTALPDNLKASLPAISEIEKELESDK